MQMGISSMLQNVISSATRSSYQKIKRPVLLLFSIITISNAGKSKNHFCCMGKEFKATQGHCHVSEGKKGVTNWSSRWYSKVEFLVKWCKQNKIIWWQFVENWDEINKAIALHLKSKYFVLHLSSRQILCSEALALEQWSAKGAVHLKWCLWELFHCLALWSSSVSIISI